MDENEMAKEIVYEIESIKNMAEQHIVPFSYSYSLIMNEFGISDRWDLHKYLGFSLISLDWIIPLSKWIGNRKCLEVMAGSGMLSYSLQQQGISIISTDNFSWEGQWNVDKNYWTGIQNIDAVKATKKYCKNVDIIFMSWPYMDSMAYKVLKTMRNVNKKCIMIYIGEDQGGCNADDKFFKNINYLECDLFYESVENFKSWYGIHDRPVLIN
jgi:16S rRNA G966 N2-methylase RsmD